MNGKRLKETAELIMKTPGALDYIPENWLREQGSLEFRRSRRFWAGRFWAGRFWAEHDDSAQNTKILGRTRRFWAEHEDSGEIAMILGETRRIWADHDDSGGRR
jgi:hypothetical protein